MYNQNKRLETRLSRRVTKLNYKLSLFWHLQYFGRFLNLDYDKVLFDEEITLILKEMTANRASNTLLITL